MLRQFARAPQSDARGVKTLDHRRERVHQQLITADNNGSNGSNGSIDSLPVGCYNAAITLTEPSRSASFSESRRVVRGDSDETEVPSGIVASRSGCIIPSRLAGYAR